MERQPTNQHEKFCPKCNKWIIMTNFLLHQLRCKGNAQSNIRPESSSMRNRRIQSNSNISNHSNNSSQIQQKIPCSFCGYGMTLKQLDTHPALCQNQDIQCQQCHKKFPQNLMEDHLYVCEARRDRFSPQQQQEYQYQQEIQERQPRGVMPPPFHPFFNWNRSPSRQQRSPQQRLTVFRFGNGPIIFQSSSRQFGGFQNSPFFNLIELLAGRQNQQRQPGLKKQQINKLQKVKYHQKEGSDKDLCTICYCQFEQGETINKLSCKHLYHHECIGKWLQSNASCPVCKKSMLSQERKRQQNRRRQQEEQLYE